MFVGCFLLTCVLSVDTVSRRRRYDIWGNSLSSTGSIALLHGHWNFISLHPSPARYQWTPRFYTTALVNNLVEGFEFFSLTVSMFHQPGPSLDTARCCELVRSPLKLFHQPSTLLPAHLKPPTPHRLLSDNLRLTYDHPRWSPPATFVCWRRSG